MLHWYVLPESVLVFPSGRGFYCVQIVFVSRHLPPITAPRVTLRYGCFFCPSSGLVFGFVVARWASVTLHTPSPRVPCASPYGCLFFFPPFQVVSFEPWTGFESPSPFCELFSSGFFEWFFRPFPPSLLHFVAPSSPQPRVFDLTPPYLHFLPPSLFFFSFFTFLPVVFLVYNPLRRVIG